MKLQSFENSGFTFSLTFANGDSADVDLQSLIGEHVSEKDLASARIDPDWGCLEFCGGTVDIAPETLYRFAISRRGSQAA
jgi:hypothetical protein